MWSLLFPVIAWYDIIGGHIFVDTPLLLFPVIAWYDIMFPEKRSNGY